MPGYYDTEQYVARLEPWMREVFQHVRMLILTFPEVKETIRYRMPFFDAAGRMMMYLASFEKKRFVLGFCHGNLMPDPAGVLKNDKGQTLIKHWEFIQYESIDDALLVTYIRNAIIINQQLEQHVIHRKNS